MAAASPPGRREYRLPHGTSTRAPETVLAQCGSFCRIHAGLPGHMHGSLVKWALKAMIDELSQVGRVLA